MVSVLLPRSFQEVVDTMASKNPELVAATANKLATAKIISNQRAAVNTSM